MRAGVTVGHCVLPDSDTMYMCFALICSSMWVFGGYDGTYRNDMLRFTYGELDFLLAVTVHSRSSILQYYSQVGTLKSDRGLQASNGYYSVSRGSGFR